jgi:hypothetical protein
MKPHKRVGYEFTKQFYDLGLYDKYNLLEPVLPELDKKTFERAVDAILQHSSLESRKLYPCLFIRKLSRTAKMADEAHRKENYATTIQE